MLFSLTKQIREFFLSGFNLVDISLKLSLLLYWSKVYEPNWLTSSEGLQILIITGSGNIIDKVLVS